jgi:hypothetical protein
MLWGPGWIGAERDAIPDDKRGGAAAHNQPRPQADVLPPRQHRMACCSSVDLSAFLYHTAG